MNNDYDTCIILTQKNGRYKVKSKGNILELALLLNRFCLKNENNAWAVCASAQSYKNTFTDPLTSELKKEEVCNE
jgi:hypothetical protein